MITDLKPYPAMKDSGIEWLGEVPEHWDVMPNRTLFDEIKDRDYPDEEMLSVTIKKGVIRQSALLENTSKKDSSNLDRSNYKLVQPGDIAYNKMRVWQGAIGVSVYRGIISPAYVVQRPRDSGNPSYFHHLFRIPSFAKEAERWSYGITSDMWSLRPEHFKIIYSCLPLLHEQDAIVRYLGYIDRRVRRLVRAKQKLIVLLEEQKQAVIHQAVTRGLDPDVSLKDSGVEWLGEVPEHWEVRRVKTIFRLRIEKSGIDHGKELLSIYTHIGVRPRKDLEAKGNKASTTDDYWIVRKGDIISNKLLAWMGAIGVSHYDGVTSPAYDILMPVMDMSSDYYHHLFRTKLYLQQFKQRSRGIMDMRLRLYFDQFGQIRVPVPPAEEQRAIVDFYRKGMASADRAIDHARREIDLFGEYLTRLIADVVTGKLDVREAVAGLPDEVEDIEPLDDADTVVSDPDTISEEADT